MAHVQGVFGEIQNVTVIRNYIHINYAFTHNYKFIVFSKTFWCCISAAQDYTDHELSSKYTGM